MGQTLSEPVVEKVRSLLRDFGGVALARVAAQTRYGIKRGYHRSLGLYLCTPA